jgi:thiamine-monophosphate kinase
MSLRYAARSDRGLVRANNEDSVYAGARLLALADEHGCELVGGDTTRGPLNICITVFGEVPLQDGRSQALLRSGARAGDDLYVSGTFGDAALALDVLRGRLGVPAAVLAAARLRLERPSPRVALGQALRGIASAAIDVSDGLLGDLGHVLHQSGVGATVDVITRAGEEESWRFVGSAGIEKV